MAVSRTGTAAKRARLRMKRGCSRTRSLYDGESFRHELCQHAIPRMTDMGSRRRLGLPAEAQPIPDQAAARLGGQRNVSDEFGATASALKHDLATVECLELGPVPNADNRQGAELRGQKLHQGVLAVGIKRRGCHVEHHDIRLMQEDAYERQA